MAEQNPEVESGQKKRGLPLMPILAVGGVLIAEAVVIVALFMFSGGPSAVKAEPGVADEVALGERPAEALVVSGKFQNTKSGRSFMYDTEVYVVVKQKHLASVEERISAMQASIQRDITTIFRRAEPSHLREQELATLTGQIRVSLNEHFGRDDQDEPIVDEVLIAKCMEFASDY